MFDSWVDVQEFWVLQYYGATESLRESVASSDWGVQTIPRCEEGRQRKCEGLDFLECGVLALGILLGGRQEETSVVRDAGYKALDISHAQ